MRRFRIYPQDFLHHRWRNKHPFRQRISRRRRCAWMAALLFLSGLIAAYMYVSDPARLRVMAESYLSSVLSGRVEIGQARLSIFQGLTLEDVRVFTANNNEPDALFFSARSLSLNYSLGALVRGEVRATQIIATQPLIRIVQNVDKDTWNYQRLMRTARKKTKGNAEENNGPPELPEIILRDGEIENAQVHQGIYSVLGTVWFEGRLDPSVADGRYAFSIQSRPGDSGNVGPQVIGWFDPSDRRAELALRNFSFGPGLRAMLPEEVRVWCEEHQLTGKLTIDHLIVGPAAGRGHGATPAFDVLMRVDGVNLALSPEQLRSNAENAAVQSLRGNLHDLENLGAAETDRDSLLGTLTRFTHAPPLHLHITQGSLHFSDTGGIQIEKLIGRLEGNPFAIEGTIANYSSDSPFDLRLSTPEVLNLPMKLSYVRSLPVPLQEVYDQFKPAGTCTFDMRVRRSAADDEVAVTGEVNILDGQFVFDHFPYPLRNVQGKLVIEQDPATHEARLVVRDIHGQGIAGTVNSEQIVRFAATAGPFNRHCEAHITISGKQIMSDPYVIAALPSQTQKALKLFDAPGHGEYPKFHGDFVCQVTRSQATRYHWDIDTHLDVDQCSGRLVAFPYPVDGMSTQLDVHDHYLTITDAHMQKGDAKLRIDGKVSWKSHDDDDDDNDDSGVSMQPLLEVRAENVPVDQDLIAALPPDRAKWVEAAGLGGKIDLNGKVYPNSAGDIGFDFGVQLHDGKLLKGTDGTYALEQLSANARLTDTTLTAEKIEGRRGKATVTGKAAISWAEKEPNIYLNGDVRDLMLDNSLRKLLPDAGKQMWDQLKPAGTIDCHAEYRSPNSLKLKVQPKQLAVTPAAMPWRMDHLGGSVTYDNGKVNLDHVIARHGGATLMLAGGGGADDGKWQLHLSGKDVLIDENFLRAAPKPIADLIGELNIRGKFDFNFSNLVVHGNDIDFGVTLNAHNASVDVGLPMNKIAGSCKLSGLIREGNLSTFTGDFNFDTLSIADRSASDLSFKLNKPADQDVMTLSNLQATVADGSLAGQMTFGIGEGNDHYTLDLVLRDADITQLDPDPKSGIQGQLSASMDLEGQWSDPTSRMGRGDVLVTGDHMYKIPILLGVAQITNLALPLNEPFTRGTAEYAVQGKNVVFDSMELSAANMRMSGSGSMDFGSKTYDLTFTTNNPKWPKLPIINDLITAAQKQLLQIRVTGTIQEPKVSAGLFSVVGTTIDHVIGKN